VAAEKWHGHHAQWGCGFFLVNHGRDARATLGTAVFACEAPAVKRMGKPVGDRFYIGMGGGRKVAWASCPMGLRFFLVNHGRDARATLVTAVFASEAPAVKRMGKPVSDRFYMGTGGGRKVAWASCPMGLRFFSV